MVSSPRGRYVTVRRSPDLSAFGGRAARAGGSYRAFVPDPIADLQLTLSGATAADVADAESALSRLRERAVAGASLEALTRRLMRSEAIASSWIEALQVSHRRLAEAEQGAPGHRYDEARRVLGNVRAMLAAIDVGASGRPLDLDDLRSLHGTLLSTSNAPEDVARAGQFRTEPVFIGGTSPDNADYVGPPADHVISLLQDLLTFVNERADLSAVVVAAIAHAQYESIHPHHDGNGRVGRCLVHTVLRRSASAVALPPLSVAFARPAARYVDGLTAYRAGDLDAWISVFATAVTFACEAALQLGEEVVALRDRWEQRLVDRRREAGRRSPRSDAAVIAALDALVDLPAFHTRDLAERLGRTWRAAQDAVVELQEAGIVREVAAGKGTRMYEASEVFALLDRFEHDPATLLDRGG